MANLLKIRDLLKEKKVSIRELSNAIGITEQGINRLLRENSTKVETLESIAKFLGVSISYFFDEEVVTAPTKNDRLLSIIESQQRTIETLTNKIKSV